MSNRGIYMADSSLITSDERVVTREPISGTLIDRVITMSQISAMPVATFPLPYHPPEALPATGKVFRLTAGGLKIDDLVTVNDWILPINKKLGACSTTGSESRRDCYGHSVFTDIQDLTMAQKKSPWARKKSISSVELTCGHIESSPRAGDSHHDWWPDPITHIPTAVCVVEKP